MSVSVCEHLVSRTGPIVSPGQPTAPIRWADVDLGSTPSMHILDAIRAGEREAVRSDVDQRL